MEYQKITNLLETSSDKGPRFIKYKISITGKTSNVNQEYGKNTEWEIQRLRKILKLLFH